MTAFPTLKTAKALVAEEIMPCSEDTLKALARQFGIGRKLGRAYVFTPTDVAALVEKLPCPSNSSPDDTARRSSTSEAPLGGDALTKALARATEKQRKTSLSKGRRNSSSDRSTVIPLSPRLRTLP